ncbi:MAG TPA: hypothetical protein VNT79_05720 [Phycisphaerae bacterium]|nr:hypothetical protein [Phycisphaerae bacterium]
MNICSLIDLFFAGPQFILDGFLGLFGADAPDLSAPLDTIFGCVTHH